MSARVRSLLVLIPVLAALVIGGGLHAGAQTPTGGGSTSTTADLLGDLLNKLLPTTVPPTTAAPAPGPAAPGPGAPAPKPTTTTTSTTRPPGPGVIPPEFASIINSVKRTGGRNTSALVSALKQLQELGVPMEEIVVKGMGQFPVGGEAVYSDDWLNPRFNPSFHLHEGTDIFAARGTPVRAPGDGVVRFSEDPSGGRATYLTLADGTYYYMCHLDSWPRNVKSGQRVTRGQIVGFVGDSGNAVGGSPHLHFEIHPGGGGPINPKPILDAWLDKALADVPALLASYQAGVSRALTATAALRSLEAAGDRGSPLVRSADGPLLWASTLSPGGGALRLAEMELARAAERIDWESRARLDLAEVESRRHARQMAESLLGPVTPPGVRVLLGQGGS